MSRFWINLKYLFWVNFIYRFFVNRMYNKKSAAIINYTAVSFSNSNIFVDRNVQYFVLQSQLLYVLLCTANKTSQRKPVFGRSGRTNISNYATDVILFLICFCSMPQWRNFITYLPTLFTEIKFNFKCNNQFPNIFAKFRLNSGARETRTFYTNNSSVQILINCTRHTNFCSLI